MQLTTARLILRPFLESDVDDVYAYSREKNVGPNAGWKPHESREESLRIMREIFLGKKNMWAIVPWNTNKVIGSIGLAGDPKRANSAAKMLGYAISENHWGKGYITEACQIILQYAFRTLKLALVSVYCYPHNQRSIRVIEKCGFRYEGVLRQAEKIFSGQIYDNMCFSMTRDEYERIASSPLRGI